MGLFVWIGGAGETKDSMSDWLEAIDLRGKVKKEIYDACVQLAAAGWKFRRQGHGYRAYCPCDRADGGRGVPIPGSPPNPGNVARRLLRNCEHCPDSHELMR